MAYKRKPTVWTHFTATCGECQHIFNLADEIYTGMSGGCETCSYSTWGLVCPNCKATDGEV